MTDMFFFKEISGLVTAGVELNVTIKRSGENLIVSVLPKVTDLKMKQLKNWCLWLYPEHQTN